MSSWSAGRARPILTAILREHLRRDARERETAILSVYSGLLGATLLLLLLLHATGERGLGPVIAADSTLFLITGVSWTLLRSGHFHPAVCWFHSIVEVSGPALFFFADLRLHGAAFALTAPGMFAWSVLVMLSGLRGSPRLAVFAGSLAAIELGLISFVGTRYGPLGLPSLTPKFFAIRSALLFATGVETAVFARHFTRKAEEALVSLRERDLFGRYFLFERIGAGGMAEVYRAVYCPEGGFERPVAIKRILPAYASDPAFLALFRREAELGAMLVHPNIVQVLDAGKQDETVFLALEYVDGLSLRDLLAACGALPLQAATYVISELAEALAFTHQRRGPGGELLNLVHRDVNPPNVLISRTGEVKLSDFGIARANQATRITRTGEIRGKLGYMAPEQLANEALDARVDLYALGCTLFEVLTGVSAQPDQTEESLRQGGWSGRARPPSLLRPEVPREVDSLVLGLLEPDLETRIRSATLVRDRLRALPPGAAPYPEGRAQLMAVLAQGLASRAAAAERASAATVKLAAPQTVPLVRSAGHS